MRSLVIISLLLSFCKSDTRGAWDKEIDLRDHGFLLQLKYDEPLNPLKGGKVHLNLQTKYLRYLRYLHPDMELRDLDIDFGFSEVGAGSFKGQVQYKYSLAGGSNTTGTFDFEAKLEGGIWKLLAGVSPLAMPFIQLEAGVNYPEKTTKVRAIVKGGPSLDLDFTAIFSGSGFGVFAALGDLASFEIVWNGAKSSILLSRDRSSMSKWNLQLTKPGEHNPTYNFTINGRHISDLKISGELNDLDIGIGSNPWTLMGYPPKDIEGGPWRLLIELTTKKTSSTTSLSEFVAKLTSSQEEELTLLEFQCTKSMVKNSTTLAFPGEPFVLDIDYTLGDRKHQRFNKANILVDIFKASAKNLEISLQNEKKPEKEEFSYKLEYDTGSMGSSYRVGQRFSWFNYISLMESGCTGCPNRTIEKLTGNYSWTDLRNPEKFELRSEDNLYSEAQWIEAPGSGLPFVWLGRLYEATFGRWTTDEYRNTIATLSFESGFPLYQLARITGVEGNERNLGQPTIQFKVIRQLVYEKNTVDRFLNFYGTSLETVGKLTKLEQAVFLHGAMWHYLDYQVTSEHKRSLILESAHTQQTWIGDIPRHSPASEISKVMLDYKLTYGRGESLETILASAGGFILRYKDTYAYKSNPEKVKHALDIVVDFLEHPKTRGLKCLLDWKVDLTLKGSWKAGGTTSVFK